MAALSQFSVDQNLMPKICVAHGSPFSVFSRGNSLHHSITFALAMPAITLSFVNVPAAGQAQKDVPVNVPTSEAFYSFTREFLPWGAVNNGMAALP